MLSHSLVTYGDSDNCIPPVTNELFGSSFKNRFACHHFGACFVDLELAQ
jgi:hypothetical protein